MVKILGAFLDTLVLNVYPADASFEIEDRRLDENLKAELMFLKRQAQEEEEEMPTRFVFRGLPLLMKAKGCDGFNWILHNRMHSVAANRSSKVHSIARSRLSSDHRRLRSE